MTRNARIEVEVDGDATGAVRAADRTSRAYRGMGRDLDGVDRSVRRTGGGLSGLAGGLRGMAGPAAIAVAGLGAAAGAAFSLAQSASDAAEAASAAEAVFGKAYGAISEQADDAAYTVGLSRTAYLDSAKTFGVLGQAAGLSGDKLASFSTDLVGIAGDLASFNNTSVDEAIAAIGSGLRGEAEPLRRFGILLDDATLRTKALELGLIKTTKDALTPQQKTLAAQAVIMGQLGAAQGDFARTSGGLANQQRILKAETDNLKASLGESLLPVTNAVVGSLVRDVVPALRTAAGSLRQGGAAATFAGSIFDVYRGKTAGASNAQLALGLAVKTATTPARNLATFLSRAARPAMDGWRTATESVRAALARHPQVLAAVRNAGVLLGRALSGLTTAAGVLGRAAGSALGGAFRLLGSAISGAIGLTDRLINAWRTASNVVGRAVGSIRSAVNSLPGAGILGRILGGGASALTTGSGARLGPSAAFATAASSSWSPTSTAGVWSGAAPAILAPTTTVTIRVDGALDPEAVARQIEGLLRRYHVLIGRA